MHRLLLLRGITLDTLEHALVCHKDHLVDVRDEYSDSARGALNGTDFAKFDRVSSELNTITKQISEIDRHLNEIVKARQIGETNNKTFQFSMYTEHAPALALILENYTEMQSDVLRGELLSIAKGQSAHPANTALMLMTGEDKLLERTIEGAYLQGLFEGMCS